MEFDLGKIYQEVSNLSIHRYLGIIIHVARKTLYTREHSPIINYYVERLLVKNDFI